MTLIRSATAGNLFTIDCDLTPASLSQPAFLSVLPDCSMSVDFGADLKDQVPALVDTLEVYHSHLSDVASFYAAQAEIERSFAEQQQSLLRKVWRAVNVAVACPGLRERMVTPGS